MPSLTSSWMPHFTSLASVQDLVHSYGLGAVFVGVMLESMGVPVPAETVLVTTALYAGATHQIGIANILAVAAMAAILGDNLGFLMGRSIGLPLLTRHGHRVGFHQGRIIIGQYLFLRHGGKIVFFGRFVALLRTFAAVLAGANRMHWRPFLVMNALGGICWATLFGGGAYLLGDRIRVISGPISLALLVVVTALVVIGIIFMRHHEAELEHHARKALAENRQDGEEAQRQDVHG